MARRKKDTSLQAARDAGRLQARQVLKLRADARRRRQAALQARRKRLGAKGGPALMAAPAGLFARHASAGALVAEGDSWFDYPFHDILELLEDDHGYDVSSVAHKGDPIEEMAYGAKQLADFTRTLEKLLDQGTRPRAVLLSGGGDDIAGDAFGMLLNHSKSSIAGLNASIVHGVIHERIRSAYATILGAIAAVCESKLGAPLPVLVHGYDYAVPDGRGFLGGWGPLPGPWLEPGFREKGFLNLERCKGLVHQIIDEFNTMLGALAADASFSYVHYIDLRGTLPNGPGVYKDWWANELHPTEQGFEKVTGKFVRVLDGLA